MRNFERIEQLETDLGNAKREYLRINGWDYNCNYPGSYWMWSKTIQASGIDSVNWQTGVFHMNTDGAVSIQRALDNWFTPDIERGEE